MQTLMKLINGTLSWGIVFLSFCLFPFCGFFLANNILEDMGLPLIPHGFFSYFFWYFCLLIFYLVQVFAGQDSLQMTLRTLGQAIAAHKKKQGERK